MKTPFALIDAAGDPRGLAGAVDTPRHHHVPPLAPLRLPHGFRLSVLIPVYNEQATLPLILARVLAVDLPQEVIVVDDGSTDGTSNYLRAYTAGAHPNVRVFRHAANRGKGAALRTAIPHATGTVCITQDADLEYDPRDYPHLLRPLLEGRADAVYGSRFLAEGAWPDHLSWRGIGNRLLTALSNRTTRLQLTDMETGYKVIRTELLQRLPLTSDGFEIEPEITARLAQAGARIAEVPIHYHGRGYAQGKKIRWQDGVRAVASILRHRPAPPRGEGRPDELKRAMP